MAVLKYSTTLRNNQLDAIDTTGTGPYTLFIRTLAPPTDCAAADVGAILVTIVLPSPWLNPASGGQVQKAATIWQANAGASGIAAHFRIKDSTNAVLLQGDVGMSAGFDMILDNTNIGNGQSVTINTFQIQAGNA